MSKYAAIDLSEWEGHETEEYLEIFMKFIHDYTGYFNFKYIFITGCIEKGHYTSCSVVCIKWSLVCDL